MKILHSFTLPVTPISLQKSGKRIFVVNGKPRFFKDKKAQSYQNGIVLLCRQHFPESRYEMPLALELKFVMPRPQRLKPTDSLAASKRPDLDNLIKGTQDALSEFWVDDDQIVCLIASKKYAPEGHFPCIGVTICDATSLFDDAQ